MKLEDAGGIDQKMIDDARRFLKLDDMISDEDVIIYMLFAQIDAAAHLVLLERES